MRSYREISASTPLSKQRPRQSQQQKNHERANSMTKLPSLQHLRLREKKSGANKSARRKRPREKGNASSANWQSRKPKRHLKKPGASIKPVRRRSRTPAPRSTGNCKRRKPAGKN